MTLDCDVLQSELECDLTLYFSIPALSTISPLSLQPSAISTHLCCWLGFCSDWGGSWIEGKSKMSKFTEHSSLSKNIRDNSNSTIVHGTRKDSPVITNELRGYHYNINTHIIFPIIPSHDDESEQQSVPLWGWYQ